MKPWESLGAVIIFTKSVINVFQTQDYNNRASKSKMEMLALSTVPLLSEENRSIPHLF